MQLPSSLLQLMQEGLHGSQIPPLSKKPYLQLSRHELSWKTYCLRMTLVFVYFRSVASQTVSFGSIVAGETGSAAEQAFFLILIKIGA